jgi:hypothetical protein
VGPCATCCCCCCWRCNCRKLQVEGSKLGCLKVLHHALQPILWLLLLLLLSCPLLLYWLLVSLPGRQWRPKLLLLLLLV